MNNNERAAVSTAINSTREKLMQDHSYQLEALENADWKVAACIHSFLEGKIDALPRFEFIDELQDKKINDVLSIAYGTILMMDNDIKLDCEDIIRDDVRRVDVISSDDYKAYEDTGRGTYSIDPTQIPRFNMKRVEFFQKYLKEYKNTRGYEEEKPRQL